jgi:hypothetical protein
VPRHYDSLADIDDFIQELKDLLMNAIYSFNPGDYSEIEGSMEDCNMDLLEACFVLWLKKFI